MTRTKLESFAFGLLLFLVGALLMLCAVLFTDIRRADAACGSLPYIFVNNVHVVDANTTNANNNFLLGCAINVDNTQIGSAGIFASQIIPTGVGNATFTSAYGWRITSSSNLNAPLTIVASSAPATDIFDVDNNTLATKYIWVDSGGVFRTNSAPVFGGPLGVASGGTGSATQNFVDLSTAQTVAGVKTFSSAPVMSGASITTGTVPDAALVTAPVTAVTASGNLSSSGGTTPAITETASPTYTNVTASGYVYAGGGGLIANAGDLQGSRSASTGYAILGGTTGWGGLNYNVTNANALTFVCGGTGCTANVYATNFFTGSKRSYKTDIHPLRLDGIQILRSTCWSSYHYKREYGDPTEEKIGFIADCTPDVLSGPFHDHFDAGALSTVDAQAILQLAHRLDALERMVQRLCAQPHNRRVKECSSVR